MLIRSILFGMLLMWPAQAFACDACGCSVSQSFTGLMPQLGGHFAGLWWQQQRYRVFREDPFDGERTAHSEYFNFLEARARFQPHRQVQLSVLLPYAYHSRWREGGERIVEGAGDAVGFVHVQLFNNADSLMSLWRHRLALGLGIKAPTGDFQRPGPTEVVNPNFQVGTGSWDALFNLSYTLRRGDWGFNLDATYRRNGESPNGYRFGERVSGVASLFRLAYLGPLQLMPNAGIYYEYAELDTENGFFRTNTGGEAAMANAGLELFWQRFNLGFTYSTPLQQNWNSGLVEAQARTAVHLNYFF